jgi:hypothetical protein
MNPPKTSARYFLQGFIESGPKDQSAQESVGAEDDKPSKFKTADDYLNEGPAPDNIEEAKDHLIETSIAKKTVNTPYT